MKKISRFKFLSLTGSTVAAVSGFHALHVNRKQSLTHHKKMHGLIGKIIAKPGRREELIRILVDGVTDIPGCLSYIVSMDLDDHDAIWIKEIWDSKESHNASLTLPSVQKSISMGQPLIAKFIERNETEPVGGHGLASY